MNKILIFGKNGQVGSQIVARLQDEQKQYIALSSKDVDLSSAEQLQNYLDNLEEVPSAIIDAAAYTAVDKAEEGEGKKLNYLINRDAPIVIAKYCKEKDIPFVYYTSDYVFDGSGDEPFTEDNIENLKPLNEYGKAKLEAEEQIQKIGGKYLIFRTSWVYNEVGNNFVNTMIRLFTEREEISVVDDQIGFPTYARNIAKYTLDALQKSMKMEKFPSGIYHMVDSGDAISWYDFAKNHLHILVQDYQRQLGIKLKIKSENIKPIKTSEYPTPAKRPLNSRLNTDKLKKVFDIMIQGYGIDYATEDCILEICEINKKNKNKI